MITPSISQKLLWCLLFTALAIRQGRADCAATGYALNHSYTTLCAEVDNIDIPLWYTNVTAYRITATPPRYSPTSIDDGTPDFTSCNFSDGTIWRIGTFNGSTAEFLTTITNTVYNFYAPDNPAEGVDQAPAVFPNQINVASNDVYIHFTANEANDANVELKIGATFRIDLVGVTTTLQLRVETWNGAGWTDQGARTFTNGSLSQTWNIPDFTWLPGTDANNLHIMAVPGGSGPGAQGYYDALELKKRGVSNDYGYAKLFDNGKVIVEAFQNDFWWRAPESMRVDVVGGSSMTNAQWFRINKQTPTNAGWNQFFVLYQDGNARIIPLPPNAPYIGHWGASFLLGPSADSVRPYAAISRVTIDPTDVCLNIVYQDGSSNHVELLSDREKTIVDVSGISFNTATQSFARFRSMWVTDGKADIDRVHVAAGTYPIMNGWSALTGSWWEFLRDVPTYHNTYSPEYRLEILQPSQTFTQIQAESYTSTSNGIASSYANASGGSALNMSALGDEASYAFTLDDPQPFAYVLIEYSDIDGGDNGNTHGNTLRLYLDGVYKGLTYTVSTAGSNDFERTSSIPLGNLQPGPHTIKLLSDAGTSGCILDVIDLVSARQNLLTTNVLVAHEGELPDSGSGFAVTNRSNASNGQTLHMATNGGSAAYNLLLPSSQSNAYARIRHSDPWGPTRMDVYIDGSFRAKSPSISEPVIYWTLNNPGFETPTNGPGVNTTVDGWFMAGGVSHESWAARFGPFGVAFHGWENSGYILQEISFSTNFGNVFTFSLDARMEPNFKSTNRDIVLQLEFWSGTTQLLYKATNNIYALLTNNPNVWQSLLFRFTNTVANANLVKIMAVYGGVTNTSCSQCALSFDDAALTQSGGSDWNSFTNSPLLYLGYLSSGIHTVRVDSSSETAGLELDKVELVSVEQADQAPDIRPLPASVTLSVGATTTLSVYASDVDPDCVDLANSSSPTGSTFLANTFAWTPGAGAAGTTSIVAFTANDQRGATNSVVVSNVIVVVPYDYDGDGMGDNWEWSSFTTLTNLPGGDPDGDGIPNGSEFIAGTAPTSGGSYFGVTNQSGTGIRLVTVPTQPSRMYTIYYADGAISNGMTWSRFANTNIGFGAWMETNVVPSSYTFIDDNSPSTTGGEPATGVRNYHVRVELP